MMMLTKGRPTVPDANAVSQAEDYADLTIQIDFAALAQLADDIRIVTTMDVGRDLALLAQLMANLVTMINRSGQIAADKRQESNRMNPLAYKICVDFSTACVASFAQSRGYNIDINSLPRDQISLALLMNDWELLVRIFEESLHVAHNSMGPDPWKISEESPGAVIQHLEWKFAEVSPVPGAVGASAGPQLCRKLLESVLGGRARELGHRRCCDAN